MVKKAMKVRMAKKAMKVMKTAQKHAMKTMKAMKAIPAMKAPKVKKVKKVKASIKVPRETSFLADAYRTAEWVPANITIEDEDDEFAFVKDHAVEKIPATSSAAASKLSAQLK